MLACGTKGRKFESPSGAPMLRVTNGAVGRMGLWPLSPGQTDKMTVEDTVTVTSGRGQLWRGDM